MDISKVYVLDSKFPSEYTVSAEGDFLELIYYDYQRGFWHVPCFMNFVRLILKRCLWRLALILFPLIIIIVE